MITSNGSVLLVLLAACLCILSYLLWQNFHFKRMALQRIQMKYDFDFEQLSNAIEQERSRISSELHDELGTLLSIIYFDLELVFHEASSLTPHAENRLREVKKNLDLVIESIRTNIWNLSAQMFEQSDFAFIIRELCHKLD